MLDLFFDGLPLDRTTGTDTRLTVLVGAAVLFFRPLSFYSPVASDVKAYNATVSNVNGPGTRSRNDYRPISPAQAKLWLRCDCFETVDPPD